MEQKRQEEKGSWKEKDKSVAALPDHVRQEEKRDISPCKSRKQDTQGTKVN